MRTHLSNPKNIRDAYVSEPQLKPVAGSTRYVSCVRYNARAANDVYMGNKDSMAIFFAGDITQFLDATKEVCGNVVWQKFPELEQVVP